MHKFDIKNIEKLDNPKRKQIMPAEDTLKKFINFDEGTLLDIGCGIGYFTIPAAKILNKGKVIGIDIIPEMIDIAKEKSKNITNIEYLQSSEYSFPIDSHSIDYVFICNVIHELEDKTMYFHEIKRVLKSTGFLYLIDWKKKETEMGPSLNERISKDEIINICSACNLKFIEDVFINEDEYGLIFQ